MKTPLAGPAAEPTPGERRSPPDRGRSPRRPPGRPLPERRLLVGPDRRRLHRRRPRRLPGPDRASAGSWPSTPSPTPCRCSARSTGWPSGSTASGPPTSSSRSRAARPAGSGPRIEQLTRTDVRVHWIVRGRRAVGPLPTVRAPRRQSPPWPWRGDRIAKRALDVLGSALGLLLLAPLFAVVAAGDPDHLGPADLLHPGAGRAGRAAVPDVQVPEHEARRRGGRPGRSGPRTTTTAAPRSAPGSATPTSTSCPSSSTS